MASQQSEPLSSLLSPNWNIWNRETAPVFFAGHSRARRAHLAHKPKSWNEAGNQQWSPKISIACQTSVLEHFQHVFTTGTTTFCNFGVVVFRVNRISLAPNPCWHGTQQHDETQHSLEVAGGTIVPLNLPFMPWAAQKCTHLTSLKIIQHPKKKWPKDKPWKNMWILTQPATASLWFFIFFQLAYRIRTSYLESSVSMFADSGFHRSFTVPQKWFQNLFILFSRCRPTSANRNLNLFCPCIIW